MIGIDIIEHDRFYNKEKLIKRVLSIDEYKIYEKITSISYKLEYVSSRFAAKEAIAKIIENEKIFNFNEISILNDSVGRPYIKSKIPIENIEISISHSKNYSIAIAIRK